MNFLMVIIASGTARGRVRTTTTTESRKMAIIQIIAWFIVYFSDIGLPRYDQLTPVKTRYPLTRIM